MKDVPLVGALCGLKAGKRPGRLKRVEREDEPDIPPKAPRARRERGVGRGGGAAAPGLHLA